MSPVYIESTARELVIPDAIPVSKLEHWTGGDIVISPVKMPMTTWPLLLRHIESGAVMVQVKRGDDLSASIGDRLNDSLARMHHVSRRVSTHWLLFIGVLTCNAEGDAHINGHRTRRNHNYWSVEGALSGWMARGGLVHNIPREGLLGEWCMRQEMRLNEYRTNPLKHILSKPDISDDLPGEADTTLQLPVRVRDGRRVLIGFEGLGEDKVGKVWDFCGDLKSSLHFLTDESNAGVVEGIGLKTIQSVRKQCGLQDGDGAILYETNAVDRIANEALAKLHAMPDVERKRVVKQDTEELFGVKGKR